MNRWCEAGWGVKPCPAPIMPRLCPSGTAQSQPNRGGPPHILEKLQASREGLGSAPLPDRLSDAQSKAARSTRPVEFNLQKPKGQRASLQQEGTPVGKERLMTDSEWTDNLPYKVSFPMRVGVGDLTSFSSVDSEDISTAEDPARLLGNPIWGHPQKTF